MRLYGYFLLYCTVLIEICPLVPFSSSVRNGFSDYTPTPLRWKPVTSARTCRPTPTIDRAPRRAPRGCTPAILGDTARLTLCVRRGNTREHTVFAESCSRLTANRKCDIGCLRDVVAPLRWWSAPEGTPWAPTGDLGQQDTSHIMCEGGNTQKRAVSAESCTR